MDNPIQVHTLQEMKQRRINEIDGILHNYVTNKMKRIYQKELEDFISETEDSTSKKSLVEIFEQLKSDDQKLTHELKTKIYLLIKTIENNGEPIENESPRTITVTKHVGFSIGTNGVKIRNETVTNEDEPDQPVEKQSFADYLDHKYIEYSVFAEYVTIIFPNRFFVFMKLLDNAMWEIIDHGVKTCLNHYDMKSRYLDNRRWNDKLYRKELFALLKLNNIRYRKHPQTVGMICIGKYKLSLFKDAWTIEKTKSIHRKNINHMILLSSEKMMKKFKKHMDMSDEQELESILRNLIHSIQGSFGEKIDDDHKQWVKESKHVMKNHHMTPTEKFIEMYNRPCPNDDTYMLCSSIVEGKKLYDKIILAQKK